MALLRVALGAGLIATLIWRADLDSVLRSLDDASIGYVAIAYALVFAAIILGAVRWRPFLSELGFHISARVAIRLTLIGGFFNTFLPTGVGGDAYKALHLSQRAQGSLARSLASVVLDRAAGLVGMAMLAVVGVSIQIAQDHRAALLITALGVGIVVILAYGALQQAGRRQSDTAIAAARPGIRGRSILFLRTVADAAGDTRTSARGLTMGVVTGLMLLGANDALVRAMQLPVPLGWMSALLLLVSVVAVIPISINGLGLREATYVWGLTSLGINHDAAVAFALLALGAGITSSAVGGVVYAFAGGSSSAHDDD